MEKKNNGLVIILMGVIIVILAVLCILFATNTIELKSSSSNNNESKEILENEANNQNIENQDNDINNTNENKDNNITNININEFLNTYSGVLGWNYIISKRRENQGIIGKNEDILANIANRQLIVGEYVATPSNESKFIVFNVVDGSKIESSNLYHETSLAFYPYDEFNIEYKKIFGEDFAISKQEFVKSDYELVDQTKYVYYLNYRAGSNGIYLKEMNPYDNKCSNNICTVKVKMTFSDRFKNEFGFDASEAVIGYHIKNNSIALDSFKEM